MSDTRAVEAKDLKTGDVVLIPASDPKLIESADAKMLVTVALAIRKRPDVPGPDVVGVTWKESSVISRIPSRTIVRVKKG